MCRHEDGTVRFWDASGVCLCPVYKLSTAAVFHTDADPNDNMNMGGEGEWPPFRKVSCYYGNTYVENMFESYFILAVPAKKERNTMKHAVSYSLTDPRTRSRSRG